MTSGVGVVWEGVCECGEEGKRSVCREDGEW